ncbi:MAG TPA: hypothetical protein VF077_12460 [Nitrospiraceae bacterium]
MALPPNGRDQLSGAIAGQSFALTTSQLLPILILLVGGVGGYLVWQAQDRRLVDLASHQREILMYMQTQDAVHRERLNLVLRVLETHDYNATREPGERLPLMLSPGEMPGKPLPP